MEGQLHISSAGIEHLRSYARKGDKPLLLRLAHFYETENPESGEVTTFVGPHMMICGEGTIWDQTEDKKMVKIEEMIWAVGIEDLAAIEGRYIDLAYIPSQLGKASAVLSRSYGTSGKAPANSTSRAGAMPEASGIGDWRR